MLAEPAVISSQNGVLRTTLIVAPQNVTIGTQTIQALTYNGTFVGPTLRVRPGDRIELTLENCLSETTNLHFHGMDVTPSDLGDNIFRAIDPAQSAPYVLQVPPEQPVGTYWYHDHLHGLSSPHVSAGLSGLLVVEGLQELLPPDLQKITERSIVLKDAHAIGGVIVQNGITIGQHTTRTVNGQFQPQIPIKPGETQLWRIANIGANITYMLKLDGHSFHVLAEDGHPVWEVKAFDQLLVPTGKRFDVLVQGGPAGSYKLETLAYTTGPAGNNFPQTDLATLVSAGDSQKAATLPTKFGPNDDLTPVSIGGRQTIEFSEDPTGDIFFINGRTFDHNRVDVTVKYGTIQEWTITNVSDEEHPFHIHQLDFQVMSVNGQPYNAVGLQDIVMIPKRGEVVIRMPFLSPNLEFMGKWVFHCHILNHEDFGMMAVIEVVP
ncbi:MAG: putative multicopper oxidase [Devosia sp.]|nr:putative multicopper oxidase [Devosia sp.]